MSRKRRLYEATEDGCVIETKHGTLIHDDLEGIPAEAIAEAYNHFWHEKRIDADWKLVEQRLVEKGVLSEARS
jgi:hypothetical protein